MLKYKNYFGKIGFDDANSYFYGEVVGLKDIITFQGKSASELENAFKVSIDDYIDFCEKKGESAEKPYSGKTVLRMPPDLHRKLAIKANLKGMSLNAYIVGILRSVIKL